jgi:hypothetical protein
VESAAVQIELEQISRVLGPYDEWDDLRFPAGGLNLPGGSLAPGVEDWTGALLFDAAATEAVVAWAQMPHSWIEGTTIVPHVHWSKTTSAAGNVAWQMGYRIFPIGSGTFSVPPVLGDFTILPVASSPISATPDSNTAGQHLITNLGDIDLSGNGISTMICVQIGRVGGNAADTYGADARLMEFDIHYRRNSLGSERIGTKV